MKINSWCTALLAIVLSSQLVGCYSNSYVKEKYLERINTKKTIEPENQAIINKYKQINSPPILTGLYYSSVIGKDKEHSIRVKVDTVLYIDDSTHQLTQKDTLDAVTYLSHYKFDMSGTANYSQFGSVLNFTNAKGDYSITEPWAFEIIDNNSFYQVSYCDPGLEVAECVNGIAKIKYSKKEGT